MSTVKQFNELTTEELAGLTDEQIQGYIDYECLENGVAISVIADPEPRLEFTAHTETYYQVGGIVFARQEDAVAVAGMPAMEKHYAPIKDYRAQWFEPRSCPYSVETVRAATKEAVLADVPRLRMQEAAHNEWEERQKSVVKNDKAKQAVEDEVWTAVRSARYTVELWDKLAATFLKYLEVARGDRDTAIRFMAMAHKQFDGEARVKALAIADKLLVTTNKEKVVIS